MVLWQKQQIISIAGLFLLKVKPVDVRSLTTSLFLVLRNSYESFSIDTIIFPELLQEESK
jgi:hypothetical protein